MHRILCGIRGALGGAALVLLVSGCAGGVAPQDPATGLGTAVRGDTEAAAPPAAGAAPPAATRLEATAAASPPPATPERAEAAPAARAVPGPVVTRGMERNIVLEGQDVRLHCDDGGSIDIEASRVILVVTGHCQEIEVMGSNVTVKAEVLDELDISGNGNTVDAAEAAELKVEGEANSVTLGTVGEVDAAGSANTITFESGAPDVEDTGGDNSIAAG